MPPPPASALVAIPSAPPAAQRGFCPGSREEGCNLAVFFHGCNFDCRSCPNALHTQVAGAPAIAETIRCGAARRSQVRCVFVFGGSLEPQFPFALPVTPPAHTVAARLAAAQAHLERVHVGTPGLPGCVREKKVLSAALAVPAAERLLDLV
ncbi:MAG: hypothetical protein QCH35_09940 [Methanomicrobiaceae archaeon]|nr:hypothetical protein [Methanomicrobiaceae archaeon]